MKISDQMLTVQLFLMDGTHRSVADMSLSEGLTVQGVASPCDYFLGIDRLSAVCCSRLTGSLLMISSFKRVNAILFYDGWKAFQI